MTKNSSNSVVSAFSEEQVEALTGISVHRLRYWDRTGFFVPAFANEDRRVPYSRIYSFMDVAALRVLGVLIRQHSVPLQHLREVAQRLCNMDNSAWVKTTLYVLNKKVNFEEEETGRQREVVSGQYAIGIPLQKIVSDTREDVRRLSERTDEQIGKIKTNRYVSHNAPVLSGTRIPVRAIKNFAEAGYSIQDILKEYPTLTEVDVKAALEYKGNNKAA